MSGVVPTGRRVTATRRLLTTPRLFDSIHNLPRHIGGEPISMRKRASSTRRSLTTPRSFGSDHNTPRHIGGEPMSIYQRASSTRRLLTSRSPFGSIHNAPRHIVGGPMLIMRRVSSTRPLLTTPRPFDSTRRMPRRTPTVATPTARRVTTTKRSPTIQRRFRSAVFALGEATVNQVVETIPSPPTAMAVRRMMHILEEKGHLRRRESGREVVYAPRQPKDKAGRRAFERVLETFFGGSSGRSAGRASAFAKGPRVGRGTRAIDQADRTST